MMKFLAMTLQILLFLMVTEEKVEACSRRVIDTGRRVVDWYQRFPIRYWRPPGGGYGLQYRVTFKRGLRSANGDLDHTDIFRACDGNNNGQLTFQELRRCAPQPTFVVKKIFDMFDKNGDGVISSEEFASVQLTFGEDEKEKSDDCYSNILRKCGVVYVMYSRERKAKKNSVCNSMKKYVRCVLKRSERCENDQIQTFIKMLAEIVQSTKEDGACPDIDIKGLDPFLAILDHGDFKKDNSSEGGLPCSQAAVTLCDAGLFEDIHYGMVPCDALDVYGACIETSLKPCDDREAGTVKTLAEQLLLGYISTDICN